MENMFSVLLSVIYVVLGVLHFYWACGGEFVFDYCVPTKENGEMVFRPRIIDSVSVGVGLIIFGIYYMLQVQQTDLGLPNWVLRSVGWIIPSIFLIRAIGDFKYVGFFKKIRNTKFGKADTQMFSVLCLLLSCLGYYVNL